MLPSCPCSHVTVEACERHLGLVLPHVCPLQRSRLKLVGHIQFKIGAQFAEVHIQPVGRWRFRYVLWVNHYPLREFLKSSENQKL